MEKTLEGEHAVRLSTILQEHGGQFIDLDEDQLKTVNSRKKNLFINLEDTYKKV